MKPHQLIRQSLAIGSVALLASPSFAAVSVDGSDDNSEGYSVIASQSITTGWGSGNVLANLRAVQESYFLNLLVAGRASGNAFLLFIDSKPGGVSFIPNNLVTTGGEEWMINNLGTSPSAGLTFENGFLPDYAVRIYGSGSAAYVNRYDLQAGTRSEVGNAGPENRSSGFIASIRTQWDDVVGTYADHYLGAEMSLSLAALGVPTGNQTVKVMAILVNDSSTYGSNQVLASGSGAGDIGGAINSINFETEAGVQTISIPVSNPDTEPDGMPDSWESQFGLTVGVDDSGDDGDTDDSSNLQEYQRGTLPNVADTDGDGLKDGWESNTGTWVSGTNTGTDPLVDDSDGDGLKDGMENNSGTFVSATDTGTNPNKADTDNDGLKDGVEDNGGTFVSASQTGTNPNLADTDTDSENDGTEVYQGTNPTDGASSSAALGIALIDGTRDNALYGSALAVQTIETGFGDNSNEWNAAYGYIKNGKLYLMFTGNLENNFNKLEIFIDSQAGGSNVFNSAGNDGAGAMDGMTFDTAFTPEYHLIARRGTSKFDLDFAKLTNDTYSSFFDVFLGTETGRGITGTGPANTSPIRVAYNGSNTAGIGGNTGVAADQVAAAAVTTGLELCIDLADLGSPTGAVKVMLLQSSNDHNYLSNQSLGGLPVGYGNLANPVTTNFSNFEGDQFFTVLPPVTSVPKITQVTYLPGTSELQLSVEGLVDGNQYKVQESTTLQSPLPDRPGSQFTASGDTHVLVLPVTPGTVPAQFFRVATAP